MAQPVVACRGLSKRFANGTLALKDMTLDVDEQRVRLAARPVGLRQVHGAADDRRAGEPTPGSDRPGSAAADRRPTSASSSRSRR